MTRQLEAPLEPGASDDDEGGSRREVAGLSLLALGIVYGDIGTSPLYALRECFHGPHAIEPTGANVLGVLSLVLWSLMIVISAKYLAYVLLARNRGEGGILALAALLLPPDDGERPTRLRRGFIATGLFGAALLYADGSITPAISVLSAVEGLSVATSAFDPYVVPIAIGILLGLFLFQRSGTGGVGRVFGPVMALWFVCLATLGVLGIVDHPEVLRAADPRWALRFFAENGFAGYAVLGAVFLVVTGGEALYADVGHFGPRPIQLSWAGIVLPALTLNYFGQGALLVAQPDAATNPFYRLAPDWALYPLVALSTAATVIASQAVISGAFSLTRQAIQLGYLPRMKIRHTSAEHLGQVVLPSVQYALMLLTIGLVLAFGHSSALAGAYGVAVSTTMVVTSALAGWVAVERWGWRLGWVIALSVPLLAIDLAFLGANLLKLPAGGWFPLALAAAIFLAMTTWKRGTDLLAARFREVETPLEDTLDALADDEPQRVPGTAVFLTASAQGTPTALIHQLEHNQVLHERVVVLNLRAVTAPHIDPERQIEIEELPLGFRRVSARFGFREIPRIDAILRTCERHDLAIDAEQASFYVSREVAIPTEHIGMPRWRAALFALMARNARRASEFLHLPHERVIELGVEVEL